MKIYSYFNCKPCFVYFMTFIMYSCSWSTCSPAPWSGLSRLRFTLAQTSKNGFSMPLSKLAKSLIWWTTPISTWSTQACPLSTSPPACWGWFYGFIEHISWKISITILSVTIPPWITILFKNTASFYVYLLPALPLFQP